jgi:2-polyprenyl-3-methyl-5-hydroxy-6-metoxy-1,4-benzoquinol methylase
MSLQQPKSVQVDNSDFNRLWDTYWLDVQAIGPLTYTRFRLMLNEVRCRLVTPPDVILDVGCGSGAMLSLLKHEFPEAACLGIEPSSVARAALPEVLRPHVLAGDVLELEPQLPSQIAQLVVCSEVLEHVPDPQKVLASIAKLAAPGALLILTVPSGMQHWSVQDDIAGHLRRFEAKDFKALLESSGLQVLNLYVWGGPVSALYNRLINRLGPTRAANCGQSFWGRAIARILTLALRFDDFFIGTRGFQLVAAARKP